MLEELLPILGLKQTLILLGFNPATIEDLLNNTTVKQ